MIRCEHCGSTLPDGAIFCGECGRAVTASASRRAAPVETVAPVTPPPLQQPDAHGRRQDPATDAWLPEATLDPATRAWLSGRDRPGAGAPAVPVDRPGGPDLTPRGAPTHVHGSGSGLGAWTGQGQDDGREARGAARPDPRVAPGGADTDAPTGSATPADTATPAPGHAPSAWAPAADATTEHGGHGDDDPETTRVARRGGPSAPGSQEPDRQDAAPVWGAPVAQPAAPEPEAAPQPPAGPSWWIGRGAATDAAVPTEDPTAVPGQEAGGSSGSAASGPDAAGPGADGSGAATTDRPRPGDTAVVQPLADLRAQRPTPLVRPGAQTVTTCHVCGHQLEPDDIFCEECGAVRPAVTAAFTGPVMPLPLARPDWAADEEALRSAVVGPPAGEQGAAVDAERSDETVDEDVPAGTSADGSGGPEESDSADGPDGVDARPDVAAGREDIGDAAGTTPDHDDQHGHAVGDPEQESLEGQTTGRHRTETAPEADDHAAPHDTDVPIRPADAFRPGDAGVPTGVPRAAPLPPLPDPAASLRPGPGTSADDQSGVDDEEDVEATRIVTRRSGSPQFVLHCSTGERLGVHGTGLLGRLPRPAPDERFDDLLTIHDPGKSVSKTHLEFGRDGDDLWVADRFSGNGTVVRHIDGSIRRCEPGRRYRVERGARVDIGEQFFLVQ